MEEIEVVIKVSERKYKGLQKEDDKSLSYYEKVIANGTPLPKGHGRLIDADALRVCFYDSSAYQEGENFCYYSVKDINNAPTIIEADKEEV